MLIAARTNANATAGPQEAARRLLAYQETGVDALFLPYLKRREDLDQITQDLKLPVIVAGSDAALFDLDYLASRNVKVWLWGHQSFGVAMEALFGAMKSIHEGVAPSQLANKPSRETMQLATHEAYYKAMIEQFLK
jgi:carboxyvinyl-carboxyphosphonate phosphorylmutase